MSRVLVDLQKKDMYLHKFLIFSLFLTFTFCVNAQKIQVDPLLSLNADLLQVTEPLELWKNFLSCKNDTEGAKYWNQDEVKQYSDSTYFQLRDLDYFELGDYISNLKRGATVLSISKIDSFYKITTMFSLKLEDSSIVTPFIFHVYAGIEMKSGKLKLYNPFPVNKQLYLKSCIYKNVNYIFPSDHRFNKRLANKQNQKIRTVENEFQSKLHQPMFIFSHNKEMLYRMLGYDFHFEISGNDVPSGKADEKNNVVYSHGVDEYCPHELIHLLVNPKWPAAHLWFIEGFATYFGDSRGKDLDWHLQNLKQYLIQNPTVDFNTISDKHSVDMYTDYRYVIGGLIVKLTYEKGGAELVDKLMTFEDSELGFYKAIEDVLGVKRIDFNGFVRRCL